MRKDLKQFDKQKILATATFVRYGNSYQKTKARSMFDNRSYKLLFRDIKIVNDKDIFIGHMWFAHSKCFKNLGLLEKGDTVEIYGMIRKYTKKTENKGVGIDYEIIPIRIDKI